MAEGLGGSTSRPSPPQPGRREQTVEVLVFLFLILPSLLFSFFAVKQGSVSFALISVSTIMRDLSLASLILFFIWRNKEPVAAIGWRAHNILREAGLGVLLYIPLFFASALLENTLQKAGFSAPSTPLPALVSEKGMGEFLLAFVMVVVVAVVEETIFRGYLMLRLKAVTSSVAAAVVLSAFVFSLGHGYEGTASVVTIGIMGAFLAVVYEWRKSLTAPIVMHFLQDFIGIVLVPFLKYIQIIN
ncbi:MAG: type II CAAX endopeptidase family protein [Nitrospirota bacterium]|jgi:membrane protease YdiL (CAAX protease family)